MAEETTTAGQVPSAGTGDTTVQNVSVLPNSPGEAVSTPPATAASVLDSTPKSAWIAAALIVIGLLAVFFITKKGK